MQTRKCLICNVPAPASEFVTSPAGTCARCRQIEAPRPSLGTGQCKDCLYGRFEGFLSITGECVSPHTPFFTTHYAGTCDQFERRLTEEEITAELNAASGPAQTTPLISPHSTHGTAVSGGLVSVVQPSPARTQPGGMQGTGGRPVVMDPHIVPLQAQPVDGMGWLDELKGGAA